jgi:hypothetical protein
MQAAIYKRITERQAFCGHLYIAGNVMCAARLCGGDKFFIGKDHGEDFRKNILFTAGILCAFAGCMLPAASQPKTGITAFTGSMRNFGKFSLDGY